MINCDNAYCNRIRNNQKLEVMFVKNDIFGIKNIVFCTTKINFRNYKKREILLLFSNYKQSFRLPPFFVLVSVFPVFWSIPYRNFRPWRRGKRALLPCKSENHLLYCSGHNSRPVAPGRLVFVIIVCLYRNYLYLIFVINY